MRPSESLRQLCIEDWNAAVNHPFCLELAAGTLCLDKMRCYLVQDYTFIDNFVRLAASAIHFAPTLPDRLPLAQFLGVIAGPENTYFQRSFDQLEVPLQQRSSPELLCATAEFQALMLEAAKTENYGAMIAVLCVAEWVYLSWADPLSPPDSQLPFYFSEWISLHSGDYFSSVIEHLRSQLDQAYSASDSGDQAMISRFFSRAVSLERAFFDATYAEVST